MPNLGLLLVHLEGRLVAEDFDALASTVDQYLNFQGRLQGVVVEVPRRLAWANLGSIRRQLRFVREHQRRVRRIALVSDRPLARLALALARPLVDPEVRRFGARDREQALHWASERTATEATVAAGSAGSNGEAQTGLRGRTDAVEEASKQSFPASDPPSYTPPESRTTR